MSSGLQAIDRPEPRLRASRLQLPAPVAVELRMDTRAHTPALPMELVRPYLLIACIAFATGFLAFVALGRSAAPEAVSPMTLPAAMSAPVPPAELAPETFV